MSPRKVYTAFYAYYATRGGVCTLRRGARAALGCAGGGCARSRVRSWLRGGLAGMVWGRQGPAYISEHTASSHNSPHRPHQRAVVRHVDVTDRACPEQPEGVRDKTRWLVGSVQQWTCTSLRGSPVRGAVSGDGRPPMCVCGVRDVGIDFVTVRPTCQATALPGTSCSETRIGGTSHRKARAHPAAWPYVDIYGFTHARDVHGRRLVGWLAGWLAGWLLTG